METSTLAASTWLVGALLLIGVGCAQNQTTNSLTTPSDNQVTTSATDTKPAIDDFVLKVGPADYGYVNLTWTKPINMPEGSVVRLMHSSTDNPTFPTPENGRVPYWKEPSPTRTNLMWSSIPRGTRYFRACIYQDKKCVRHSNTVMMELK